VLWKRSSAISRTAPNHHRPVLIAGLAKWGETSRLTLLLPTLRSQAGTLERPSGALLALGAEGNIRVANCTTPAQYFHLLRRQRGTRRSGRSSS